MEYIFPQALLSTPGMVTMLIVVGIAELFSLGFLWLAAYEYKQLRHRHTTFFRAISGNTLHEKSERTSRVIFFFYVISTVVITVATTLLFIFQPHLI